MEDKLGRIALLFFMAVILVYTIWNYFTGGTGLITLVLAVFIALTSGRMILQSLIDDFKK